MKNAKKNYRKLIKMLKKDGFEVVREGNHVILIKDGHNACVTRNVKDPNTLFKDTVKRWEREKAELSA